jgi:hypothetical protein
MPPHDERIRRTFLYYMIVMYHANGRPTLLLLVVFLQLRLPASRFQRGGLASLLAEEDKIKGQKGKRTPPGGRQRVSAGLAHSGTGKHNDNNPRSLKNAKKKLERRMHVLLLCH